MAQTVSLLIQVLQFILVAAGTYMFFFGEQARALKKMGDELDALRDRQEADQLERSIDLERWKGGMAASVGHDLEEAVDSLDAAIDLATRGEDVLQPLMEAQDTLYFVIANLASINPDVDENEIL